MSALAGIVRLHGGDGGDGGTEHAACDAMLAAQRRYAPDAPAIWADGGAAFGRRLRALLPEDDFDRGPVIDARGRVLVADVRIDNRGELSAALGLDARRLSDAALLAAALARWDVDAIGRVVGDFAFALWDPRERLLLLARDHLGMRPLHVHSGDGFVAFASMPRGLHALPAIPRAADPRVAAAFLALEPEPADASFFAGVEKVPPGHWLAITPGGRTLRAWWDPQPVALRLGCAEDYAEALRERMDAAVAARLRGGGGTVAAQLSGGLDSSTVAATAARLLAPEGGRIVAYTAVPREGFDGGIEGGGFVDEGPLAAATAALYPNIEHVRIRTGERSPLDGLERMTEFFDRPLLNMCNFVWGSAILEAARARGLGVLLTGSAGNASFSHAGMERLTALFAQGRWLRLAREGRALMRGGTRAGTVAAQAVGPFLPAAVMRGIARARRRSHDLRDVSLVCAAPAGARAARRPALAQGAIQLGVLRRTDYGNWTKGVLGGWGIDMRDPTTDRRLIEFCLTVPVDQYLADGVPRALARRAFADRLPAAVVGERRKGYQAADWYEGMAGARAAMAAEVEHLRRDRHAAALIDLDRARALIDRWPHDEADWRRDDVVAAYRLALMRGVATGRFLRNVAGTN